MVELLDNPDHRGTFQTMKGIAAITTSLKVLPPHTPAHTLTLTHSLTHSHTHSHTLTHAHTFTLTHSLTPPPQSESGFQQSSVDIFYVVVTVFPSNDECRTSQQAISDTLITLGNSDNYNPIIYTGSNRVKNVTIEIEPALSGECVRV